MDTWGTDMKWLRGKSFHQRMLPNRIVSSFMVKWARLTPGQAVSARSLKNSGGGIILRFVSWNWFAQDHNRTTIRQAKKGDALSVSRRLAPAPSFPPTYPRASGRQKMGDGHLLKVKGLAAEMLTAWSASWVIANFVLAYCVFGYWRIAYWHIARIRKRDNAVNRR